MFEFITAGLRRQYENHIEDLQDLASYNKSLYEVERADHIDTWKKNDELKEELVRANLELQYKFAFIGKEGTE